MLYRIWFFPQFSMKFEILPSIQKSTRILEGLFHWWFLGNSALKLIFYYLQLYFVFNFILFEQIFAFILQFFSDSFKLVLNKQKSVRVIKMNAQISYWPVFGEFFAGFSILYQKHCVLEIWIFSNIQKLPVKGQIYAIMWVIFSAWVQMCMQFLLINIWLFLFTPIKMQCFGSWKFVDFYCLL
jgi:hypothetical protein